MKNLFFCLAAGLGLAALTGCATDQPTSSTTTTTTEESTSVQPAPPPPPMSTTTAQVPQ